MNAMETESSKPEIDTAGVFAAATSIWSACEKRAKADPALNLSEAYNGMDQLMREVMRVGEMFENWACLHVAFEEFSEVWPYFLQDRFGDACLTVISPEELAEFGPDDCLRVAYGLKLPLWADGSLHLPVDVCTPNSIADSAFKAYRIQTVRDYLGEEAGIFPFMAGDDPFDEDFGHPYFGLYGIGEDELMEHIADRKTYADIRSLALKLCPGAAIPSELIYFPDQLPSAW